MHFSKKALFPVVGIVALAAAAFFFVGSQPATAPSGEDSSLAPDGTPFEGPNEPPPDAALLPESEIAQTITPVPTPTPQAPSGSSGTPSPLPAPVPTRAVAIEGGDFFFSPDRITAQPGERLRLTFTNTGQASHTFDIDELNAHTGTLSPGASKTVEVTAPASSVTYRSYCAIPGHVERGMVGQLVVTP